jgi:hypothetical protein
VACKKCGTYYQVFSYFNVSCVDSKLHTAKLAVTIMLTSLVNKSFFTVLGHHPLGMLDLLIFQREYLNSGKMVENWRIN